MLNSWSLWHSQSLVHVIFSPLLVILSTWLASGNWIVPQSNTMRICLYFWSTSFLFCFSPVPFTYMYQKSKQFTCVPLAPLASFPSLFPIKGTGRTTHALIAIAGVLLLLPFPSIPHRPRALCSCSPASWPTPWPAPLPVGICLHREDVEGTRTLILEGNK